ncbi:MAG TPA: hypothetical protein VKZ53_04855 [Candidatus Angelobacter sp.]|nr:hypothetical protein [Candidatus Angelobacter sp.]
MPGTSEDRKAAANIYTSLSSYVITASLGVIAAQAALAAFILDKREHLFWFYFCAIAGLVASVASIVFGGSGINDIAEKGFEGEWTLKLKHDFFNYQAISSLIGIIFLIASLFCGTSKVENTKQTEEIQQLKAAVNKLQSDLVAVQSKLSEDHVYKPAKPNKRAHIH